MDELFWTKYVVPRYYIDTIILELSQRTKASLALSLFSLDAKKKIIIRVV